MTMSVKQFVTPAMATEWLAHNDMNRDLRRSTVNQYAVAMQEGRWFCNGQPIIIATDGTLLDGQHRLSAIVAYGKPVEMYVTRGIEKAAFDTIDNGVARKSAHVLQCKKVKHPNMCAAIARSSIAYVNGLNPKNGLDRQLITNFVEEHPYIVEASALAKRVSKQMAPTQFGMVVFLADESRKHDAEIESFVTGIQNGIGLMKGDPRLTLREWVFARKRGMYTEEIDRTAYFGAVVRAWNAWAQKRKVSSFKLADMQMTAESLPIVGFSQSLYVFDRQAVEARSAHMATASVPDASTRMPA